MHVAFVPIWPNNPYHLELATALRALGVRVAYPESLKSLYADWRAGLALDVVHLHALPRFEWTPGPSARCALFYHRLTQLQRAGVRVIWTVHDLQNHEARQRGIEDFLARTFSHRVNALIVHGASAGTILRATWGEDIADRLHVIPHGNYIHSYPNQISRTEARASFGFAPANLVFSFLGLIRPYKGVVPMVEAFRSCNDPDIRLLIAGKPLDNVIEKEIRLAIQEDSRIQFRPGYVAPEDIQVYLNASDVFVLPYQRILTSGAAVLGMSFGKACIAPRAGCVTDMLTEGAGALFFDPAVRDDLKRVIHQAVACRERLSEMGLYNLRCARDWDWDRIARATASVYTSITPLRYDHC